MIKCVAFDNGNVLIEDAWNYFLDEVARYDGVTFEQANQKIADIEQQVVIGKIEFRDCIKQLQDRINNPEAVSYLLRKYSLKPEMEKLLENLRSSYRLVLLSNDRGDYEEKDKVWQMERFFCPEDIFLSSKIGVTKPSSEFFEVALQKIGLLPDEIVFVDDKQRNLDTARELGMETILFKTPEQFKNELQLFLGAEIV